MTTTPHQRERRRRDLRGRVARATWPARQALGDFAEGFPCNLIGHRWVEVPETLRRSLYRGRQHQGRMRFRCSRCHLTGGFSN